MPQITVFLFLTQMESASWQKLRRFAFARTILPMTVTNRTLCILAIFFVSGFFVSGRARAEGMLLDRVIASVDGEPITLSDVREILPSSAEAHAATIAELPGFRSALDQLINEKLLKLETEERRIRVADEELDAYVENVATHNKLSLEEFTAALEREGKNIEQFRRSVKLEILRSKLASSLMEDGGGVTQSEVDAYIKEHYSDQDQDDTSQVKLRQVLVKEDRNGTPRDEVCSEVASKFSAGTSFEQLARDYSDSPEASRGGDLGLLSEEDLNPLIAEAITSLEAGEISKVTASPLGCHVFFVEERFNSALDSTQLEREVRERLNRQKLEAKFQTFFVSEIYKNHTIEKKI